MSTSAPVTDADHLLAATLATQAGELLVELRAGLEEAGADPRAVKDEGDRTAHDFLVAALARERPDDAVLSEEGADDLARLTAPRAWIVDPLDGTREFAEPGRADWAVHVALVVDEVVRAAAVALPAEGLTLGTVSPPVLAPARSLRGEAPRIVVSRSRPPAVALAVADAIGAEIVPLGSAGAKAMAVVRNIADVYVHAGGQYEWDSAAPIGVAAAAGLHVSRLDGSPLRYNQPNPWLPDLVICRMELADAVLAVTTR